MALCCSVTQVGRLYARGAPRVGLTEPSCTESCMRYAERWSHLPARAEPLLLYFHCTLHTTSVFVYVFVGIPACDSLVYVIFLWPCAHNDGMPGLFCLTHIHCAMRSMVFAISAPCSVCASPKGLPHFYFKQHSTVDVNIKASHPSNTPRTPAS